jgi:probable HAF family extracellular repeat protein
VVSEFRRDRFGHIDEYQRRFAEGLGISINGEVVGYSSIDGYCGCHGFVYSKASGMQDLNTMVGAGWLVQSASAINSSGQIVASGYSNGSQYPHALLLTPQ